MDPVTTDFTHMQRSKSLDFTNWTDLIGVSVNSEPIYEKTLLTLIVIILTV